MRTWYGYDAQGCIRSIESHHGGWPPAADFSDPSSHPQIQSIIEAHQPHGVVGYCLHDCPCPSSKRVCSCHNDFASTHYVDGTVVRQKPLTQFMIDGVSCAMRTRRPVGQTITLQVVGQVPDGATVQVVYTFPPGPTVEVTLTFSNGATPEQTIEVAAPTGYVGCWGKLIRPRVVYLDRA